MCKTNSLTHRPQRLNEKYVTDPPKAQAMGSVDCWLTSRNLVSCPFRRDVEERLELPAVNTATKHHKTCYSDFDRVIKKQIIALLEQNFFCRPYCCPTDSVTKM